MGGYSKFRVVMWETNKGRETLRFVSGHRTHDAAVKAQRETAANMRDAGKWTIAVEKVDKASE